MPIWFRSASYSSPLSRFLNHAVIASATNLKLFFTRSRANEQNDQLASGIEAGRQVIASRAADELGLATPAPVRWSMWALPQ